jgi:1-acyl-sn-glycerol-3-phosphate acyltransferase
MDRRPLSQPRLQKQWAGKVFQFSQNTRVSGEVRNGLFLPIIVPYTPEGDNPLKTSGKLACLWFSQVARVAGETWLRLGIVQQWVAEGETWRETWLFALILFVLPDLVLAPVIGTLIQRVSKKWVLWGAAALGVAVALTVGFDPLPLLACWGLLGVSAAFFRTALWALLAEGAQEGGYSSPRVNALFEMGTAGAVLAGLLWNEGALLTLPWSAWSGLVIGLYVLSALLAWPSQFASDPNRPAQPGQARVGFFDDLWRLWDIKEMRLFLGGLACVQGILVVLLFILGMREPGRFGPIQEIIFWLGIGWLGGALLVAWQKHPRRVLAFVPAGAIGLVICLGITAWKGEACHTLLFGLGMFLSWVKSPLLANYQDAVPVEARGNAMALGSFLGQAGALALGGAFYGLQQEDGLGSSALLGILAGVAFLLAATSGWWFFREVLEQVTEILIAPIYRISGHGRGRGSFPRRGPVLVVANHTSWVDPLWVGKVVPRRIIPMMTSLFFDLPGMRWLMTHVAHAIRVEASTFRREVPELQEAIAALDRGETVVVFPEGALRKREDQPLKQFGQGVWHILQERPATPVVVCWIEGGWGSFCSYAKGPPTKNKRMDFWRPIRVGISPPQVLAKEVLADHRTTRNFLMQECLQARQYLGLEPLTLEKFAENGEEEAG